MLERLNQNAENLRTLHQALSDPKIKKATVSDPQYDEIKQETLNLMNMANHFVDSAPVGWFKLVVIFDQICFLFGKRGTAGLGRLITKNFGRLDSQQITHGPCVSDIGNRFPGLPVCNGRA